MILAMKFASTVATFQIRPCSPVRFIGQRSAMGHSDFLWQLSPREPHVTDLRRRSIPIRPMVRCSESCGFQSYTKKICDHQLTTIYLSLKQCEFNKSIILPSIEYSVERTIVCVPIFFCQPGMLNFMVIRRKLRCLRSDPT